MENKFTNILNKLKNLPIPGKVQAAIKIVIFTDIAVLFGLWIGIKMFFPDDFVISKINEMLFAKDLAVVADDVSVSMLGTVSFEEGSLLQKGSKAVSFKKLSFSPALFKTIGGHPAGVLSVEDINSQGGELELSFNTEENPCYSFVSDEIPLSASKPFTSDVVVTGSLSGNGDVCSTGGKYNGKLELNAVDMILRGKVPTPMGDFDVGKIVLGDVELLADVADSKVEIKKFTVNGIFELETSGKIILNNRVLASSRLDLEIKAKVPDMTKITENVALNLLVSQLSEYKTEEENSFAFSLKGFLNKPQMGKFSSKDRDLKDGRPPKKSEKPANSRPQRLQRSEKLPQRLQGVQGIHGPHNNPNNSPINNPSNNPNSNRGNVEQNSQQDELKKKEDELKRKEEELQRQEEANREREEKMREERERREQEERERREQEEQKRVEEAARIKAVQEEAMNELRRAREEIEAAQKARELPQEEGEKAAGDEKNGGDEKTEGEEE